MMLCSIVCAWRQRVCILPEHIVSEVSVGGVGRVCRHGVWLPRAAFAASCHGSEGPCSTGAPLVVSGCPGDVSGCLMAAFAANSITRREPRQLLGAGVETIPMSRGCFPDETMGLPWGPCIDGRVIDGADGGSC